MMEMVNLLVVFFISIIAGSFGTLVGGGSLITIPTLILLGLPPHTAIGTDRLGMTGIGSAGWYEFHKKRMIDYKIGFIIGVPTMLGALLGANLVFQINEVILKQAIAIITILILFFIIFVKPKMGIEKTNHMVRNHEYLIGAVGSFFLGIYGGFYGAGTATFLSYILILLFRQTFLECAATVKIAALLMTAMAASIFAINGAIRYSLAVPMFIGAFIGSYVGAHYSDKIGNVWIKRLFFVIVLTMAIKLLV
ncbi:MAG: sulfite exporter TauE/SafE family protein [Thermodesulfobacteriota bacterium]